MAMSANGILKQRETRPKIRTTPAKPINRLTHTIPLIRCLSQTQVTSGMNSGAEFQAERRSPAAFS